MTLSGTQRSNSLSEIQIQVPVDAIVQFSFYDALAD